MEYAHKIRVLHSFKRHLGTLLKGHKANINSYILGSEENFNITLN
jgi:hypothetical protein